MSFLLRMAFWFSLVLLALPFNFGGEDGTRSVGPIEALFAAKEAVTDVTGICERKPEVCATGAAAFDTISARARESARIAIDMIEADKEPADPVAPARPTQPLVHAVKADATREPLSTGSIPVPSDRPDYAPAH